LGKSEEKRTEKETAGLMGGEGKERVREGGGRGRGIKMKGRGIRGGDARGGRE